MVEAWKDINGYENSYQVSTLGQVRSLARKVGTRTIKGVLLKQNLNKVTGYLSVMLWSQGRSKRVTVHRLVCTMFVSKVKGKSQVNHKDGIKTRNILTNLEWIDSIGNAIHAVSKGLIKIREEHHRAVETDAVVSAIIAQYKKGSTISDLSKVFNIPRTTVSNWCTQGIRRER